MSETEYKGFGKDELDYQYNPRVAVPDYPRLAQERAQASEKVRESLKSWLDVPYGDSARQALDIFPAARPQAPVLIYFHGGYWRGGSKNDNCHFVETFVKRGATVVLVEYDLCPSVTVSDIVRQTRAAIAWIYKNISQFGGDPAKLYLAGQSAGGHLTAMALAHDWEKDGLPRRLIKGAAAISGVYDLDAVLHIDVNNDIRLTPETAQENSPFLHPPLPYSPLIVAVGGAETEAWKQMSEDFFQHCRQRGLECTYIEVPEANHYSLSTHLANPDSPLTRAILNQMDL